MSLHLITGGSGYVGSHIAKRLSELGEEVRLMDIWQDKNQDQKVDFFLGDITDPNDLDQALKDVDYVHHTAALVPLTKAGQNFEKVNFKGTQMVVGKSLEYGVKHISYISSSAIYGIPSEVPIDDNTPCEPVEIYGKSKKMADDYVIRLINEGVSISTIRPRTIVGEQRLGIFEILFEWIHDNANIFIIGKGDNLFQFVHIKDLAEVSIKACMMHKSGIFNVGSDDYGTVRNDLNSLIIYAKSKSKILSLPVTLAINTLKLLDLLKLSPLGPWHYLTYHKPFYFNTERTKKDLKWEPEYSNREILSEAYDWYQANLNDFKFNADHESGSMHRKPIKKGLLNIAKILSRFF